ncbi:MAG TPA: COX15/CtaA family protein [Chthoniobacterales bacterium]|nr:COX15/CtaA family protein [Chthoniobacterales bacterium]
MSPSNHSPWLNRFAWFVVAATLVLIGSGGLVTSKGVGLAVPDWPTTFGYNMFLFPFSKWIGGVFFEHSHRLIASSVGMFTLLLAVWLWGRETSGAKRWLGMISMALAVAVLGIRTQPAHVFLGSIAIGIAALGTWQALKNPGSVRWLGVIALGAVILQGVLGGLRVTMLKDEIGIFHACLAQAFLGLLILVALITSRRWRSLTTLTPASPGTVNRIVRLAIATGVMVYLQLALGATMRHQHRDLAILDFPTANGQWIPDTSETAIAKINAWRDTQALSDVNAFQIWLQMLHRFGAVLIAVGAIAIWSAVRKADRKIPLLQNLSNLLVGLVLCQIALGAWTIWSNKAADIATIHVTVGAMIFGLTIAICAISWRLRYLGAKAEPADPITPARLAVSS